MGLLGRSEKVLRKVPLIIFTDPHGCFLTFKKQYEELKAKFPDEEFCIAGDLPDRGPRTRELIQYVIDNKIPCLQGNHDDLMSGSEDRFYEEVWFQNGGIKAFGSYCGCEDAMNFRISGCSRVQAHECEGTTVFKQHREFLAAMPFYFEREDLVHESGRHLLVTHAPIRSGHLDNQVATRFYYGFLDFIWNRNKPPRTNVKNWFNVHGHNRVKKPIITEWFANIDTGCAYDKDDGYGNLTALRFPQMEVFHQECIDWAGR